MRLSPTFRGFFLAILLVSGIAALPPSSQWLNEATRYFNATWAGDTPADDQVWTYDSASGTVSWEDIPAAATGATELDELDDVTITSLADGELLQSSSGTFINRTLVEAGVASVNASSLTAGTLADARVAESNVTQHEGALTITESQISDLSHTTDTNTFASIEEDGVAISTAAPTLDFDSSDFTIAESPTDSFDITINNSGIDHDATTNYVAAEHYDWSTDLSGPQVDDANISSSSVTQHEDDLTILIAQLSGGSNSQVIHNNSGTWEATDTISLAGNVNTGTYSASGASGGIALTPAGTTYASVAAASGSYLITANTSGLVHHMYSSGADAYLEATTGDLYLTSFAGSVVVPEGTVTAHEGALTITESQISDLSHTTDTNANTICSGSTTYLDGEGNCDTLTIDSFTPTTTKGDIIVENGSNAVRLAVGTNGQVLTADSAEATGIKWATPSAGGSTTLDGLSDVTITGTPADNELLAYDSGSSEFINQTASEAGVAAASHTHTFSDVTGGSDGDIVQNVSGTWTPGSSISVSGIIESGDYSSIGATSGTAHNANGNFFSSTSLTGTTHYIGTNTNGAIFNLASSGLDAFLTATQGDLNLVSTSGDVIVPEATVTAHEAALTITESQISDLDHDADKIKGYDVAITTPTDNELLAYDSSSGDIINQTASEAGLAEAGNQVYDCGVSTGSGGAYAVTSPNGGLSPTDGMLIVFEANHANTGAATINLDSSGAVTFENNGETAFIGGEISNQTHIIARYSVNRWVSTSWLVGDWKDYSGSITVSGNGGVVIASSPTIVEAKYIKPSANTVRIEYNVEVNITTGGDHVTFSVPVSKVNTNYTVLKGMRYNVNITGSVVTCNAFMDQTTVYIRRYDGAWPTGVQKLLISGEYEI